jgi:predicted PurR-regulated permease PerM
MLGIDGRAARISWTVFLVALLVLVGYAIRRTLMVFAVAVFLAYMLTPLVDIVDRYLPRRIPRTAALAIVYLMLVGALVGLGISIGSQIGDEAAALAKQLPGQAQSTVSTPSKFPLPSWLEPLRGRITGWIQEQYASGGRDLLPYLEKAGLHLFSGAKYALYVVLVPILAFFFLKDGPVIRDNFVEGLTDPSRRQIVDDILSDINNLLGKYIRALVLLSIATFTAYSLFLGITGAAYALLLAGVAALFEFIPVIGPLAAGVVVIAVSGFSNYPHVLAFLIFWGFYRLFQDYVLSPNLMGKGVELNPVLVLFGVLAGEQIGGIPGMFFSVPVIATLRVVYVRLSRARRRREFAPPTLVEG